MFFSSSGRIYALCIAPLDSSQRAASFGIKIFQSGSIFEAVLPLEFLTGLTAIVPLVMESPGSSDDEQPDTRCSKRQKLDDIDFDECPGCHNPRSSYLSHHHFAVHVVACKPKHQSKEDLQCQHCFLKLAWHQAHNMSQHEAKCSKRPLKGQTSMFSFMRSLQPQSCSQGKLAAQPSATSVAQSLHELPAESTPEQPSKGPAPQQQQQQQSPVTVGTVEDLVVAGFSNEEIIAAGATPELLREGCSLVAAAQHARDAASAALSSAASAALHNLGVVVCRGAKAYGFNHPFPQHYTWGLHADPVATAKPAWNVSTSGRVQSADCHGFHSVEESCCSNCWGLVHGGYCPAYEKAKQLACVPAAEAAASTLQHSRLTHAQLSARSDRHKASRDLERLDGLDTARRLANAASQLATHKRLLLAISQHDIPRLHQLIAVQLRQGRSIASILAKVAEAVGGDYKAKVRISFISVSSKACVGGMA